MCFCQEKTALKNSLTKGEKKRLTYFFIRE